MLLLLKLAHIYHAYKALHMNVALDEVLILENNLRNCGSSSRQQNNVYLINS